MRLPLILTLLVSLSLPGCVLTTAVKETLTMFRPSSDDGWDPTENPDPQWDSVGIEARGGEPKEHANDPLRHIFMSEKARAIERNFGIVD